MDRRDLLAQAKDQLIRLKTRTGIRQWNILCRWRRCFARIWAKAPATRTLLAGQFFAGRSQYPCRKTSALLCPEIRTMMPSFRRRVERFLFHQDKGSGLIIGLEA
jgi:DNA sulphur modification protein DndE